MGPDGKFGFALSADFFPVGLAQPISGSQAEHMTGLPRREVPFGLCSGQRGNRMCRRIAGARKSASALASTLAGSRASKAHLRARTGPISGFGARGVRKIDA